MTVVHGVVTLYVAAVGMPLFCGAEYDTATPWLALPIERYENGEVACGDLFAVWSDGQLLWLPALDAGPFGAYCVRDGDRCPAIVADLPEHVFAWPGLSRQAYLVYAQPVRDMMERERGEGQ